MKMKKIIILIAFMQLFAQLNAQQFNSIILSNLSLDNNTLIPIDPTTGQPSDTIPHVYFFSVMANGLPKATHVNMQLGTAKGLSDIANCSIKVYAEEGALFLDSDGMKQPIMELPPMNPASQDAPKYMIIIPVRLKKVKASQWHHCTVSILDSDLKNSLPIVLER